MRNFNPKDKSTERDSSAKKSEGFNRDDSGRSTGYSQFSKDKRARTTQVKRVEKVSRENRPDRGNDNGSGPEQRRSFNPNFTKDNKFAGGSRPKKDYSDNRDNRGERSTERPDRPERTDRTDRPSYGDRSQHNSSSRPRTGEWKPKEGYTKGGDKGGSGSSSYSKGGSGSSSYGKGGSGSSSYSKGGSGSSSYSKGGSGSSSYSKGGSGSSSYDKGGYAGKTTYANKSGGGYTKDGYKKDGYKKKEDKSAYGKDRAPGEYPKFPAPKFDNAIRLNRYIATSGICSRREADDFITAGLVSVNGQVITELGTKVTNMDEVKFNDSIVRSEKKIYILMNKPKGFVTTIEDPHADKTVMDIVKSACSERVYPVGRLDKNSVGVLLITNDGDLTKQLTHPTYFKKKIYQVALDKPLTKADMEQIAKGITLEDGDVFADEIAYVGESKRDVGIEIHSGRNRIVRRIFEHMGYKVQKLDRVYFAGLTKKSLKRGAWRYLLPREVAMLKSGEYE